MKPITSSNYLYASEKSLISGKGQGFAILSNRQIALLFTEITIYSYCLEMPSPSCNIIS